MIDISKSEKTHISVVARATQIRMHLQQDILVAKKSTVRNSFFTAYLKYWGISKDYKEMSPVQKLYAEYFPWSDWFDTW